MQHQDDPPSRLSDRGGGSGDNEPVKNLWVGNVDPMTQDYELRALFAPFGDMERVRIVPNKTCAFITFATLEAALSAKAYVAHKFSNTLKKNEIFRL